jgi:hypothetical protein
VQQATFEQPFVGQSHDVVPHFLWIGQFPRETWQRRFRCALIL